MLKEDYDYERHLYWDGHGEENYNFLCAIWEWIKEADKKNHWELYRIQFKWSADGIMIESSDNKFILNIRTSKIPLIRAYLTWKEYGKGPGPYNTEWNAYKNDNKTINLADPTSFDYLESIITSFMPGQKPSLQ